MNCKKVTECLLLGQDESNSALTKHVSQCTKCRQTRDIVQSLRQTGEKGRSADLSLNVLRETRRRVARVITEREKEPWTVVAVTRHYPQGRWAYAGSVAMILVLVGMLAYVSRRHPVSRSPVDKQDALSGVAATGPIYSELDSEIEELQYRINSGFKRFRERYWEKRQAAYFDVRRNKLRTRMELCTLRIKKDLRHTANDRKKNQIL